MHQTLRQVDLFPDGPLGRLGREVRTFDEIASTNSMLVREADALPDGAVAVTNYQSGGRGRLGRAWMAPRGSSLLMSVLIKEPRESPWVRSQTNGDSLYAPHGALLAAVALCEGIEEVTDVPAAVRWPNDVAVKGRKLAGVLTEVRETRGGAMALVIGMGVNCLQQAGHFPRALREKATSLDLESARPVERAVVGRAVLGRLDGWLSAAVNEGLMERLRTRWLDYCADLGVTARFRVGGRSVTGTILSIADNGDLVVELDRGGRQAFGATTTTREW